MYYVPMDRQTRRHEKHDKTVIVRTCNCIPYLTFLLRSQFQKNAKQTHFLRIVDFVSTQLHYSVTKQSIEQKRSYWHQYQTLACMYSLHRLTSNIYFVQFSARFRYLHDWICSDDQRVTSEILLSELFANKLNSISKDVTNAYDN